MSLIKNNIPNAVTCCNLICGCIAAGAAFNYNLQTALLFIILGAVFDFFDGMTARALHVSSPIGKELDSLADCVTFGVAPSAMLFTVMTQVQYPSFIPVSWRAFLPFTTSDNIVHRTSNSGKRAVLGCIDCRCKGFSCISAL